MPHDDLRQGLRKFRVVNGYVQIPLDLFSAGTPGPAGPAGPPGPGDDFGPLSNTVFVDGGTTVPIGDQDGSIAFPFATLTQGLNAMGASTAFTVFMTPGDYSTESDIALLSTPNVSIGIIGFSAYYGLGAITPELSVTLPGISGGHSTQIIHFVNCIWNTRDVNLLGTLRADWCRFLGTSGTALLSANNMSLNYCTITQRITTTTTVAARNVAFLGTGALITMSIAGGIVIAYLCSFDPAATISIVFSGGTGEFRIDGVTNFHWKAATESLVGGTKVIQDDLAA